jgi:hypothetical protein
VRTVKRKTHGYALTQAGKARTLVTIRYKPMRVNPMDGLYICRVHLPDASYNVVALFDGQRNQRGGIFMV